MESVRLNSDNTLWLIGEPASIEGSFPLPDAASDASSVLLVTGCAEITNASASKDAALLEGKARFCILYARPDGTADSFEAQCLFEHTASLPGATEGMKVSADAGIALIDHRLESGSLSISGELCIDLFAVSPESCESVLQNDPDAVYDVKKGKLVSAMTGVHKVYLKEELRIPQTMPEISRILSVGGNATVNSIETERDKLITEGELRLLISFTGADKNVPLQFMRESVSFGEIISETGIGDTTCALMSAVPEHITAEAEGDVITVSAVLSVIWIAGNEQETEYVADMFSLTRGTELTKCCLPSRLPCFTENIKRILRISAAIPDTAPEASRVLAAVAYPELTSVLPSGGKAEADGILNIDLIYTSQDAGIRSIRIRQAFDEIIPLGAAAGADVAGIRIHPEYASAAGSGRDVDVKVSLEFSVFAFDINDFCSVSEVMYSVAPPVESGISVYFADGEECMFDIMRKHRASPLSAMSPDTTSDPPERGSRIIIVR